MKRDKGFTLIEVLAALMIFSVAIIGLSHTGTQSAQTVSVLEQKMLAGVVADNALVEARRKPLKMGTQAGKETAKGYPFEWEVITRKTPVKSYFEMTVKVRRLDQEQVILERTSYRQGGG